jgi:hypothetical protein
MMRSTSHRLLLAACAALLTACSSGESAEAPEGADAGADARVSAVAAALTAGTILDVALTSTISSLNAVAGDAFDGRVVEDVTAPDGTVVIPAGSAVLGTIVEVSPASDTRSEGTLTLAVSSVTVNGTARDLDASIDEVETVHLKRGVEEEDVARVVGGAAAGAVVGRVISDARSARLGSSMALRSAITPK